MKTKFILLILLLVLGGSFALSAQTRKTTKRTVTAPKSVAANKTRARRTAQTTPTETAIEPQISDPKPESSAVPAPTAGAEKPATPSNEPVVETVPEAKPAEKPEPTATSVPQDPFAVLRDQIDAASTAPERIQLRLKLVEEFVNAGKKPEALSELHAITNTDVFDPQGFYNAGNSFARLGETDGAVGAYRKAIEQRKGRYSRAFNNLGVVLLRAGRWDEAYDALLSALKLEAFRYPEASYNLGRLYAARGQSDLAVREWRRVLAQNPDHTAAANALARVGTEGRVVVETVRATSPRTTGGNVNAAVAEKPVPTKTSKSAATASRSLVLDPTSFGFLQRARDFSEKGNTVEAVDNYKRLLNRQSGYFPPANLEVSFALMNLKRYDEAQGNLQIVVDRDGARYPISYFHLARVFELKGDLKQAETLFSQAAAAFGSQNAQFLLDVSRVREKQGNFKGALEAMESYLSLMQQQGQQPSWSVERLTSLRQKVGERP